jgi:hypothetical protein
MFENKKLVLFITKSKITVSSVTIGSNPTEKIIGQFDWTPDTLDNALLRIKRITNDNIRILLSEDFVYVVNFSLPSSSPLDRDLVRQKAQPLIPENLRETVWDFKEILTPLAPFNKSPTTIIQVVAVVKTLFETLSTSIAKVYLHIEAIEPLSYALARFTIQHDKPFLFVYIDEEILLVLAQKEAVLATERLNNIDANAINQFTAFTKDKLAIEPQNIVFCGNTKNINLQQYQNANLKVEIQNISPAISLAYKKDIKGKDKDVLNLGLLKILGKEKNPPIKIPDQPKQVSTITNKESSIAPTGKHHFPNVIIIIIFLIMLSIGGLLVYNKNILPKKKPTPTPTSIQILSPTPLATPTTEIDSVYTITILNGTGRENEATKLETILQDGGFSVVKTGNADNFNYEKTQLRFKEKVPDEAKLPLDKLLKTLYDFSIGTKLEEEYDSDILIIVGRGIKE